MPRWTAIAFVCALIAVTALLLVKGGAPRVGEPAPALVIVPPPKEVPSGPLAEPENLGENPFADAGWNLEAEPVDAGGALLPSGQPPPALPADAPKQVVFGAILVSYRGAQGAAKSARTREEAELEARKLLQAAKTDFAAAVAQGDKGSVDNAGVMPRGILEPAPEYVLFTLGVGDVGGPVDTPPGFLILKRLE